ncbi:MAG: ammonium transporter [Chloroflexota bacterium]
MDKSTLDLIWILFSAFLVFLMQLGFLCLETGLTRSKHNINVALKNLTDFGITTVLFWLIGFGLMFGKSYNSILGSSLFGLDFGNNIELAAFFLFQVMFCGTAATILSGGVAGRLRFNGYILITILISGLIYPIFGHWAWGGINTGTPSGFLIEQGFVDFAGSTVVHSVGGWVTFATLLVIGPRFGRFNQGGNPQRIEGTNLPIAAIGVICLYVGWLGFNGGSHLILDSKTVETILKTLIAGAFGLTTTLAVSLHLHKQINAELLINGTLVGLVSITAAVHAVDIYQTIIIAIIGGILMIICDSVLLKMQIDDAVGAIPVHLAGGIWGTLAVGIFGDPELLATGLSRIEQITIQLTGIFICGLWAGLLPYLILSRINKIRPLRVSEADEEVGLNQSEHEATGELLDMFTYQKKNSLVN